MPQIKVFNQHEAKAALKECPKIVRDYVKLLEEHAANRMDLIKNCISKLR